MPPSSAPPLPPTSARASRHAKRPHARPLARQRQRGAAIVTALLVVTLAVVIVSNLLWRQQVQIRSVENERLQAQATWIERAAVDWARLILRDDQRRTNVDQLGEPWAVPIAETRLSDFLGASLSTDQAGEISFLSGRIMDAQARFNLANLVLVASVGDGTPATVATVDVANLAAYRRLLQAVGLDARLAEPAARYLVGLKSGESSQRRLRPPDSLRDLMAIPGYTPDVVAALAPFAVILPERTAVNANTAEPEVLAAVVDRLALDRARELVRQRDRAYFKDVGDVQSQLGTVAPQADAAGAANLLDVRSHYFLVYGLVRHDRAMRQQVSLIRRSDVFGNANTTKVVWVHDIDRIPEAR